MCVQFLHTYLELEADEIYVELEDLKSKISSLSKENAQKTVDIVVSSIVLLLIPVIIFNFTQYQVDNDTFIKRLETRKKELEEKVRIRG